VSVMRVNNKNPIIYRMTKGFIAQILAQLVVVLTRLFEVPLFLSHWGIETYGEWLLLAAIPAYIGLSEGGFTTTTQREMAMKVAKNEKDAAISLFQTTFLLLVLLSVLLLTVASLGLFLPLRSVFHFRELSGTSIAIILLFLTGYVMVSFQCGLIFGGYFATGRYPRGYMLSSLNYLLDFTGIVVALLLGAGPVGVSAGMFAGRIVGLFVFLLDFRKTVSWLRHGWQSATWHNFKYLIKPSLASVAFPLGQALNNQGIRLVVGISLGPIAVATFSTLRTLTRTALSPVGILSRLTEPEIAAAYGKGNGAAVRKLFLKSSQLSVWLAGAGVVVLVIYGRNILSVWTHGKIIMDMGVYLLLLLVAFTNSLWNTALMVPYGSNRHEGAARFYSTIQAITIGAASLLTQYLGLTGTAIALLACEVLLLLRILGIALKMSEESIGNWLEEVINPPIGTFREFIKSL